jgi:hypothetical protein
MKLNENQRKLLLAFDGGRITKTKIRETVTHYASPLKFLLHKRLIRQLDDVTYVLTTWGYETVQKLQEVEIKPEKQERAKFRPDCFTFRIQRKK